VPPEIGETQIPYFPNVAFSRTFRADAYSVLCWLVTSIPAFAEVTCRPRVQDESPFMDRVADSPSPWNSPCA
jgi:hypothetical protein